MEIIYDIAGVYVKLRAKFLTARVHITRKSNEPVNTMDNELLETSLLS